MARLKKGPDGKYHCNGQVTSKGIGTRAQVWHGTACKTSGGLTKNNLLMTKRGRIVSRKKHDTAKKEKRLEKHGFFAQKGKFGMVKGAPKKSSKKSSKKNSTRRRARTA